MKLLMRLTLVLMAATALFASCKKAVPKQITHIPKEASFVASINSKSIQNKLVKSQITLENLLKNLTSPHDSAMEKGKKEWEDLKNSGIDLDENLYISVIQKSGGFGAGKASNVASVVGSLKDAGKFEQYLKKKKEGINVQKEKDYSYVQDGDNMVAWTNDLVIGLSYNKSYTGGMEYDSATGQFNMSKPQDASSATDLKAEMASYISLKEDASVASIPEFRDLMQDKSDVSFWANSASSFSSLPITLPRIKELTENTYTAATLNFEDGKIAVNSKSFTSKALSDIFRKYPSREVDLSLVENYPSNNVDGFVVLAFNPEIITGIINYLEMEGTADAWLTKTMGQTYSVNDLVKSIKGDIAIVVSDFGMQNKDQQMSHGLPPVKILFNAPIGDKAKLNQLLDNLVKQQLLVKQNNQYGLNPSMRSMGVQLSVDDKNILFTTDSLLLSQYRSKSGTGGIDKGVLNDFKGKAYAGYVDIEKILNAFPPNDKNFDSVLNSARQTFKDARGYADKYNDKYTEAHFELRMKDDKESSLVSLLKFFAVAGETARKHSAAGHVINEEEIMIDSVGEEPATDKLSAPSPEKK